MALLPVTFSDPCLVSVCLCVCLFFRMISQKLMQLGSSNLTHKCSTMRHGKSFIMSHKVTGQGHESQKQCRRASLHSCECWLLLGFMAIGNSHCIIACTPCTSTYSTRITLKAINRGCTNQFIRNTFYCDIELSQAAR